MQAPRWGTTAGRRLAAHLPGWSRGALLPVRVVLRDFAAFAPLAQANEGSLDLLLDYLRTELGVHADAIKPILSALSDGRAILLFDGLDEVVGADLLARVVASIAAAAATYTRCPVLATCRILDYQTSPQGQLRGFFNETLADLSDEQIAQFVDAWYAELRATGRQTLGDTNALRHAIETRAELRELAGSPLLLTMMAVVHAGRGTLPDARALLYLECIDLLLLRWRQAPGKPDIFEQLRLPQFRAADLLPLMARLGFAMHELAERTDVRPADLSELDVMRLLAEGFAFYDEARKYELAETLLGAIARGNGLLQQRGPDVYAFPHRTFQEFLAGYYLASQSQYMRRCAERAATTVWHEALLLMVGYQVLAGGELEKPLLLAEELLRRGALEQTLGGEVLNLIGRERAPRYNPAMVQPGGLWSRAQAALLTLATTGCAPEAPAALRARAGLALGTLCYGAVAALGDSSATVPFPDQRLPLAVIGLPPQQEPWWRAALAAYWCDVAARVFWYGDDNEKRPLRRVTLPYAFKIGRYPVTNADYARFIADDGYDPERAWWTEQGRAFLKPGGHRYDDQEQFITRPRLWQNPDNNNPLQPVVGISWYEAAAYCRWLTMRGHAQSWLPADDELRLPTSLEWVRAARHTDKRRYPRGDSEPNVERANYDAGELNRPSPVGCYPAGAAACGALDLAGNVSDWMATPMNEPQRPKPQKDFTLDAGVLLSAGAFWRGKEHLCCDVRNRNNSDYRYNVQGFRLVWSRVLIE